METIETKSIDFELQEKGANRPYQYYSSEIITITYKESITDTEKQAIRNLYFFSCGTEVNPFLDVCGNNFYIQMYDEYTQVRHIEYWFLATCDYSDLRFECPDGVKDVIESNEEVNSVQ